MWSPASSRSVPRLLDAVGLGLVALFGAWIAFGAPDGRSGPVLLLLAGLIAAAALGRRLAASAGPVHELIAVAITGASVLSWPAALQAAGAPTGYANANATLTSLGVIAAIGAARSVDDGRSRRAWLVLAGFLAVVTVLTGSVAGTFALMVALGLLTLSALARWPGVVIGGGLVVVVLALALTMAVAVGGDLLGLESDSGVRGELWQGAAELVREHPWRGTGPGGFAEQNPVTADADLRWAHHGYLQVAAESGVVGLTLVLALLGTAWARLWVAARSAPAAAALGSAALVLVALHATVDYVWHVPVVVLIGAVLVGAATAGPEQDKRPGWATSSRT